MLVHGPFGTNECSSARTIGILHHLEQQRLRSYGSIVRIAGRSGVLMSGSPELRVLPLIRSLGSASQVENSL